MKKFILYIILPSCFAFTSCGGKNMDETPDGSNTGPCYHNEGEQPHHAKKADQENKN